jgi:hypothetical protein
MTFALAVALTGCGTSSTPSLTSSPWRLAPPSPRPAVTATAAAVPSAIQPTASRETGVVLAADSMAEVVSGPLRVRSQPRIADDSIKFDLLLPSTESLFVVDGPVRASEYDWYLVVPMDTYIPPLGIGWVAAADHDGTPWLRSADLSCEPDPTLFEVTGMHYLDALSCYGSRDFTFTDVVKRVGCGDGGPLGFPQWMCGRYQWGEPGFGASLALPPDLEPAAFDSAQAIRLTVTAQLDDPVAKTCTGAVHEGSTIDLELLSARVVLDCRATFVASSVSPAT